MADRKITDLTALAAGSQATGDLLTIVDVSEAAATDKNKKITVESLFKGIPGNVGIGTSSPSALLHVAKGSGDPAEFKLGNTEGTYKISANANVVTHDSNQHLFRNAAGSSEYARIDSSGNLGLGTSSPGQPLQVGVPNSATGSFRAGASYVSIDAGYQSSNVIGTAAAPALIFGGDSNTGYWHPASDTLAVSTAGTERMRIDSSGNVGIGTTAPNNYTMHLRESSATGNYIQFTNSNTGSGGTDGALFGINASGEAYIFNYENQAVRFFTNSTERARFDSDGLKFGSDTAAANALDDYEEGAHTIVTNTNLTPKTEYSVWKYTKIGNQVTISGLLYVSSVSGSNNVSVSLPFAASGSLTNGVNAYTGQVMHNGVDTGDNGLAWYLAPGAATLAFYRLADNGSWGILNNAHLASTDEMYCTVTYFTA